MPYHFVHDSIAQPWPPQTWLILAGVVGDSLWIAAYIMIIVKGFKDRAYGVPMVALALNFTWEFIYAIVYPPVGTISTILRWSWFVTDAVIVYQFFRYGRENQTIPEARQYFLPMAIFTFVAAYFGQLTYHWHFHDRWGYQDAFTINLLMSILFVYFFFDRIGLAGLSYGAAWCKMLGTTLLSVTNFTQRKESWHSYSFMIYLYVATFLFDVLYILLLRRAMTQEAQAAKRTAIA
jgi:small basic protein